MRHTNSALNKAAHEAAGGLFSLLGTHLLSEAGLNQDGARISLADLLSSLNGKLIAPDAHPREVRLCLRGIGQLAQALFRLRGQEGLNQQLKQVQQLSVSVTGVDSGAIDRQQMDGTLYVQVARTDLYPQDPVSHFCRCQSSTGGAAFMPLYAGRAKLFRGPF